MADIEIEGPDGAVVSFPEGTSRDVMTTALQKHYGAPKTDAARSVGDYANLAAKGLSMGFGDRIAAAGDTAVNKVRGAFGAAPMEGTSPDYAGNLDRYRSDIAGAEARHPIAAPVVEFGSGMLLPVGAMGAAAKGASVGAKILRGALAGGGLGAAQGAAGAQDFGDVADTARNVGAGAAIGAGIGGIIPAVAPGIGAAYRGISGRLDGGAAGVSRPSQAIVNKIVGNDAPTILGNLQKLGPDAMLLDATPALTGAAGGLATRAEARTPLVTALAARDAGKTGRIATNLDAALGKAQDPIEATLDLKAERGLVHDALPGTFAASPPIDVSGVLGSIGQGLNKAVGPEASVLNQAKSFLMEPKKLATGQTGMAPVMDAEKLSNAKSALDTLINYGDPTLGVTPGAVSKSQGAVGNVRKQLNDALRTQVPGYADIMDRSSAVARQIDGIEEGTTLLGSGRDTISPTQLAAKFGAADPKVQDAMRLGLRSDIDRTLGTKVNDVVALKGTLQGEGGWNKAKIGTVFGQPASDALDATLGREQHFQAAHNFVTQNSATAPRAEAAKMFEKGAPHEAPFLDTPLLGMNTRGVALAAARKAYDTLANSAARADVTRRNQEIAGLLTLQGPQRDQMVRGILNALGRQQARAATSQAIARSTPLNIAVTLAGSLANGATRPLLDERRGRR